MKQVSNNLKTVKPSLSKKVNTGEKISLSKNGETVKT